MRLIGLVSLAISLAPLEVRAFSPWMIELAPASEGGGSANTGETDIEAAKAEYRLASDAYALGNYEVAVGHFERAYQFSQEPAILFDLGQAYSRWYDLSNDLEHIKKARRMYDNYVINLDATDLDDEEKVNARADAQQRIAGVDRAIAEHQDSPMLDEPVGPKGDDPGQNKPVHKQAWFWVVVVGGVAVVAAAVTTGVVLGTRPGEFQPELGTIGRMPSSGGFAVRF